MTLFFQGSLDVIFLAHLSLSILALVLNVFRSFNQIMQH